MFIKKDFPCLETPPSNKNWNCHLSHVESQKTKKHGPHIHKVKRKTWQENHKTYLSNSIESLHHTSARDDILCLQFCYCSRKQTPFSFFMYVQKL